MVIYHHPILEADMNFKMIFERVRLWFGFPTVVLNVLNNEEFISEVGADTIAAVGGGVVLVNRKYISIAEAAGVNPEDLATNITSHELGHTYYLYESPGKFANKVRDIVNIDKKLGVTGDVAHNLLNIVYDTTIDIMSFDRSVYTSVPIVSTMNYANPHPEGGELSTGDQYLMAFREEAEGITLQGGGERITDKVRKVARGIVEIVRLPLMSTLNERCYNTQEDKNIEIAIRIAKLIGAENQLVGKVKREVNDGNLSENESQVLGKALKKLADDGKIGEAMSVEEVDGDIEAALAELDLKDAKIVKIATALLGIPQSEIGFYLIYNDASKSIRFDIPFHGIAEGEKIRAYDNRWSPGMQIRDLDVQATMLRHGKFIPGITSLQGAYVPGPGVPKEESFPSIFISLDCSGSMKTLSHYPGRTLSNHDLVLTAIYALIHEAKKRRTKVCVNLWADSYWTSALGSDYEDIAKTAWKQVTVVGNGNSVGGLKPLRDIVKPKDLLVYITDFQLNNEEQNEAKADLKLFISRGSEVVFIAMLEHNASKSGVAYVECKSLRDLKGIALKSARGT